MIIWSSSQPSKKYPAKPTRARDGFNVGQGSGEKLGLIEAIATILDRSTEQLPEGSELVLIAGHRSGPENLLSEREQVRIPGQPGAELFITEPRRRHGSLRDQPALAAPFRGGQLDHAGGDRGERRAC